MGDATRCACCGIDLRPTYAQALGLDGLPRCPGCERCGQPCRRAVSMPYRAAVAAAGAAWGAQGHATDVVEMRDAVEGARLGPDGGGRVRAAAAVAMAECLRCRDWLAVGVGPDGEGGARILGLPIPRGRCGEGPSA